MARAAVPQHVKAVLNRLESGAVFSAMSEDGVEGCLVVALETIKLTDRTRLIKKGAVKNPVCNTPKASSVNAGGIEQATYEVENRTRTLRSRFEGVICGSGLQSVASRGAALCVADNIPSCEIRQEETD